MLQTKGLLFPFGTMNMQIQQVLEDGEKIRNKPKPVFDASKHFKMSRSVVPRSIINSAQPDSPMNASSETPSLTDLSAGSSKISK